MGNDSEVDGLSGAIVRSEATGLPAAVTAPAPGDRAVRVMLHAERPGIVLAERLVDAEDAAARWRELLRLAMSKESEELTEARADRELLAAKVTSLLQGGREARKGTLDELSQARREIARLKRENPLTEENERLRRQVANLQAGTVCVTCGGTGWWGVSVCGDCKGLGRPYVEATGTGDAPDREPWTGALASADADYLRGED